MTVKDIFEKRIPEGISKDPAKARTIHAVYQFNITGPGGGNWYVDLKSDPPAVKEGTAQDAGCTITIGDCDLVDIVTGKLNGQMAFMSGKLKVAGNMSQAMKLGTVLGA
jgi:putative sterol carrier protein